MTCPPSRFRPEETGSGLRIPRVRRRRRDEEFRLTYHRIVFGEINGTTCTTIRDELKLTPFKP